MVCLGTHQITHFSVLFSLDLGICCSAISKILQGFQEKAVLPNVMAVRLRTPKVGPEYQIEKYYCNIVYIAF